MSFTLTKDLIEQNWPLAQVRICEVLRKSGGSKTGIVESGEGKYIYKIAHDWKTSQTLERDLTAFDFLNAVGFKHISRLLKTKKGKRFVGTDEKLIYLLEYIKGENPISSLATYGELGRIMGILHKIQNFPFQTDFNADIVIADLKKNAKKFEFGREYLEVVSKLPSFQNLPKTLIHTDIAPTNTIKNKDGVFILVDWDEAGIGTTVLDVGQPLINQFISEDLEFYEDIATAFYKAYFKERKLTNKEMNYIFDAGMFWACMYIIYGNTAKRWQRIKWSIENRKLLENIVRVSVAGELLGVQA